MVKEKYQLYELFNFADGNDDILSDIGSGVEVRQGMWAQIPYSVSDGQGVVNEEFVHFVSNRDYYPSTPLTVMPYLMEYFNECVSNIKEAFKVAKEPRRFYENLLKLQEYLIEQNSYGGEPLSILNENDVDGSDIRIPSMSQFVLDDIEYINDLVNAATQKLGLNQPQKDLGGGSKGRAFEINDDLVLKITADVSEADSGFKIMRNHPKTLAEVFQIYKLIDTEKKYSFYIILQENIKDKPTQLFWEYDKLITKISPMGMDMTDVWMVLKKRGEKFNNAFSKIKELPARVLTDNPEANIDETTREKLSEFILGIFAIKSDLVNLGINSNDYSQYGNLGYKDGVLTYFDVGDYRADEPEFGDENIITLPEGQEDLGEDYDRNTADNIASQVAAKLNLNITPMRGGNFGVAYDIGNDKVLKITKDNSEAAENLMLIGKPLKHIAQPYNVYEIKPNVDKTIPKTYAIILEKLDTDPEIEKLYNRLKFAFTNILNIGISDAIEHYLGMWYNPNIDKINSYFKKNPRDAEFFKGLLQIAEECKSYGVESMDYLNHSNLGYKKNGALGFFDVGFGNGFSQPKNLEKIHVDEDGSAKFSTTNAVAQDDFPTYETNDTSPSIENDLNANSAMYTEDLEYNHVQGDATEDEYMLDEERNKSFGTGSKTVNVKQKCKLGGLGNTSAACNQGDISNLEFGSVNETQTSERYYRAVEKNMGKTIEFEPEGFYEAIDADGNPIWKYDTFWVSETPEVAASKSVGGAVMGLYSMFMQYNKNPQVFYIYEISEKPDVDISHWEIGDFTHLKEVRYRRPVQGTYLGKVNITDDFKKRINAFYEINALDAYDEPDEEDSEVFQDTDYDELLGSVKNMVNEKVSLNLPADDIESGFGVYNIMNDGQIVGTLELMNRGNQYIVLDKIFIAKGFRGAGYANDAIKLLFDYADKQNKIITLTPDNVWGASVPKLKAWYKSLGFVENKGKRKDFQTMQLMYRVPNGETVRGVNSITEETDISKYNVVTGDDKKYVSSNDLTVHTVEYMIKNKYGFIQGNVSTTYVDYRDWSVHEGKNITTEGVFASVVGKGYGKILLLQAIDYGIKNDCEFIGSVSLNEHSKKTYEELEKNGTLQPFLAGLDDSTIMWRILINNPFILIEEIDASEAYTEEGAINTLLHGKRDVGFMYLTPEQMEMFYNAGFKIINIGVRHQFISKPNQIVYKPEAEEQALRLKEIALRNNGFLSDGTPEEAREIGKILGYSDKSIEGYLRKHYPENYNVAPEKTPEDYHDLHESAENNEIRFTDDQILNQFLNKLHLKTPLSKNPFMPREYIYGDKGSLEFSRFDKGDRNEIELQDIMAFEKQKGIGSSMMKDIVNIADELGVKLTLLAKPFGNDPEALELMNLINFYRKFGFKTDLSTFDGEFKSDEEYEDYLSEYPDEGMYMYREPQINESMMISESEIMSLQDLPFKQEVEQRGGKIYGVGGTVRDEILGKTSKDLDVLITGIPLDELQQILDKYGRVSLEGESFGVLKFKPRGATEDIDISIPRTDKATGGGGHKDIETTSDHALPLEKDLERRDITINAMAKDVDGNIIDPYGGQEDIKNRVIRAVNPDAFNDDPLRMLRAVQFASRFDFEIEPKTMQMIKDTASEIKRIAAERIIIEFDKIIEKGNPRIGVELLVTTGLFKQIFGNQIMPSQIGRRNFEGVKTMAEFLFLMMDGVVQNPAEFFLQRFGTEKAKKTKIYKEMKALNHAFNSDLITEPMTVVNARSVASNMYDIAPQTLESQILPEQIENAAQELSQGRYPKNENELAINGNDLKEIGIINGTDIGKMKKSLLILIYADIVRNSREDLLFSAKENAPIVKEYMGYGNLNENTEINNIAYSAVVLTDEAHTKLLKVFGSMIPEGWKPYAHHMTLNMGNIDSKYVKDLGKEVELTVVDYAIDGLVMAIGVEGYPTNNAKPHITLAVNIEDGGKPFLSNKLVDWRPIGFSLKVTGIITEVPR